MPHGNAHHFHIHCPDAAGVSVIGEFNHWSTTATPLNREVDGDWETWVELPPGEHAYAFFLLVPLPNHDHDSTRYAGMIINGSRLEC